MLSLLCGWESRVDDHDGGGGGGGLPLEPSPGVPSAAAVSASPFGCLI